jgi:hypothetical protein
MFRWGVAGFYRAKGEVAGVVGVVEVEVKHLLLTGCPM